MRQRKSACRQQMVKDSSCNEDHLEYHDCLRLMHLCEVRKRSIWLKVSIRQSRKYRPRGSRAAAARCIMVVELSIRWHRNRKSVRLGRNAAIVTLFAAVPATSSCEAHRTGQTLVGSGQAVMLLLRRLKTVKTAPVRAQTAAASCQRPRPLPPTRSRRPRSGGATELGPSLVRRNSTEGWIEA